MKRFFYQSILIAVLLLACTAPAAHAREYSSQVGSLWNFTVSKQFGRVNLQLQQNVWTLGKYYECQFSSRGESLPHSSALARSVSIMCRTPLLEYGAQALADCRAHRATHALEEAVLANIVSTGLVSLLVDENYNGAVAHSVYYGLVLLPGFEAAYLHGDVVAYGVLVQLALDGETEELHRIKAFMGELGIPSTLGEMGVPLDRGALAAVLTETVNGPDMEHIPYPVTEEMIFAAMEQVEAL